MQPKKATWHWWLILLAGAWLAAGQPGLNVLPGIDSAPFPADKLSVVIVRESQARLSNDQLAVVSGSTIKSVPQFRVYDPDQSADKDAAWVKPALEAVKASEIKPPVLGISNGKSGAIVPLPANEAEFQALLQKHGG